MNRKSHTTSTKCQYNIADSKPRWWLSVRWYAIILIKPTNINIEPTITCTNCYNNTFNIISTAHAVVQTMSSIYE